jgi:hypothetical protein
MVPVRLYADQPPVVQRAGCRDLPRPYGVAMGSSPAASASKRRAVSAWLLESRSHREATRRKYSDRPSSAWRSANLLAASARASSARASSASRRASSEYVTPATGLKVPGTAAKMQAPRGSGAKPLSRPASPVALPIRRFRGALRLADDISPRPRSERGRAVARLLLAARAPRRCPGKLPHAKLRVPARHALAKPAPVALRARRGRDSGPSSRAPDGP